MNNLVYQCALGHAGEHHCSLSPTCKGWGCRFLDTPIDEMPDTNKEKVELFSRVYREAKQKGVVECPHYRPLFIDEVLKKIGQKRN